MGWIERVKEVITALRASGKEENEVKEIVQQAADRATVRPKLERGLTDVAAEFGISKEVLTTPEYEQQYETFAMMASDAIQEMFKKIREAGLTAEQVETAMQMMHGSRQQESNNWRKMHGLPMRRKGKGR